MALGRELKNNEASAPSVKVGIALGSGAARGWAHIGVLNALAKAGIEPDFICGSSVGALVGAAYASGQLEPFEAWVRRLTWRDVIRYMDVQLSGGGFIEGEHLIEFARKYASDIQIESLPKSFAVVATELATGQEVWLQKGSLLEGVRASCALPGLFAPVQRDGDWLADGGLVNPVPVSLCRAMGADIVIAVNLNGDIVGKHFRDEPVERSTLTAEHEEGDFLSRIGTAISDSVRAKAADMVSGLMGTANEPGVFEVLSSALNIMQDRITRSRMAGDPPDVVISPRLAHIRLLEFDQAAVAIEAGEQAVKHVLPTLDDLLKTVQPRSR